MAATTEPHVVTALEAKRAELPGLIRDHDTARNIANKVSRGSFTAVFMLQCLEAIGVRTVRLDAD